MKKLFILFLSVTTVSKVIGQVNLPTGSATFSLPMFNWQDDKSRLNSIVALSYSSGNGLKVSEAASNVGQGWSLIAGGEIIRIQSGEPDDQKPRNVGDNTKYPAGYLYDPTSAVAGCPGALVKYPIYEDKNRIYKQHNTVAADKEMDHFSFRFNGKTGIFVLNKAPNNSQGDIGIFLGDNKMKAWFTRDESMINQGIRTTINAFYIQDENGLIYKFTARQTTKVTKTKYCDANLVAEWTQPDMGGANVYHEAGFDNGEVVNPWVVNGWYLTEIEDALTHRVVTLTYENRSINTTAGNSLSYFAERDYALISHNRSITSTPAVTTITYPDGHLVTFNYSAYFREDMKNDKALASVDIQYQGRYLSKYELKTTYMIRNRYGFPLSSGSEKESARLCLISVRKIGVDLKSDDPPYMFDYYMGSSAPDDIVPPPFFHIKDIWGYYNGDANADCWGNPISTNTPLMNLSCAQIMGLCFVRNNAPMAINPKDGYAKNGLLKQITYPTGGTLKYTYAQNTALLGGQQRSVGGVHVSQTSVTDGGYSNDCNNPIVTNYTYSLAGSNESSMWGLEMPTNNIGYTVGHYAPELKRYRWGFSSGCFPFGCCKYKYQYPGILSREGAIDLTGHQKFMEALSLVLDVVNVVMVVVDVITVIIASTPAAIVAIVLDILAGIYNILFSCLSDYSRDVYSWVYYNSDMNSINPLPAQYKRVEVTESSGGNGKTVHEFTSSADYAIWEPANPALSAKQRFAYWVYGLPKKTTVYDLSGNPVKQTENVYDFSKAKTPYTVIGKYGEVYNLYPSCKCLVKESSSQRNTDWEDPNQYDPPNTPNITQSSSSIKVDIYPVITGRVELATSYERSYKTGVPSQYVETITQYSYNSYSNYEVNNITTTLSNGTQRSKYIKYNSDYWDPATLNVLTQNNIVSVPVSVRESGTAGLFNEKVTEFTTLSNGDIKPYRTLERNFGQPYTGYLYYIAPGDPNNPTDLKEIQALTYNNTGSLIGMKDEGNRIVTNIYDYNDKFVVASVINAEPIVDKAAYTSFETNLFGGWTLNGSASYIASASPTGSRSFILSSANSLSAPLNTAKAYTVSFWSNNGSVNVSGATMIKSAPTINGFTYYEYSISQGASSVTVSSSSSSIDELRLYPKTARMRTVSYDPLIGKTSECDENNRITYYVYDEKARLRFIKDDNGNIVKMYEYNIAPKKTTGPCVVTYYNAAISETFRKDNCPAGYQGSDVTYNIPAGAYSSTISQAAADMQAQYELDQLGQAHANTHGTCLQLYYNAARADTFYKEACPVGYKGTAVVYNIPYGRYVSTLGQAYVDQLALRESNANGQEYANRTGTCVVSYDPYWVGTGQSQCEVVNGSNTGNRLYQVIDQNPNSSTYNQTLWSNGGPDATCAPMININYTNTGPSTAMITLTNLSTNTQYSFSMGPYVYSPTTLGQVPPGTYDILISVPFYYSGYLMCFSDNSGGYTCFWGTYFYVINSRIITNQQNPMIKLHTP